MTDDRLPWFKCVPTKLLGALSAMEPHEGYTYVVVLLRIYEIGGPCPDTVEALSRRTGLKKSKVKEALDLLTASGKLLPTNEGFVNPFAEAVLDARDDYVERARISGKAGAKKRHEKPQQIQGNGDGAPSLFPKGDASDLDLDKDSDPEGKKDSVVVTDDWPGDYEDQFWKLYPPGRKGEKKAVMAKLAKLRKSEDVTWTALMDGLRRYVDTRPDPQFTPAPMVWLNKGRWDVETVRGLKPAGPLTMADIAMGRDRG